MRVILLILLLAGAGSAAFFGYEAYEQSETTKAYAETVDPHLDYRDLYESGSEREANDVLLLAVVTLLDAEDAGANLSELFRRVEWINQTPVAYSDLLQEGLLRNLKIARGLGLDSPENRERMREEKSPIVELGPYAGEKAEVDHIAPRTLAPDLDNLLINLELMPQTLNRKKSDKVTDRIRSFAKRFYDAGVMMTESFERVMEAPLEK